MTIGTSSSKELSETLLPSANSSAVIVTTRQKLESALKRANRVEEERGTNRFKKLMGEHIVFVVDECHRALSSEGMKSIQEFFPNSTWFGFTGTPIFEENKKQAQGSLARTTHDQYGEVLHTYTIKNALEDGAVLGFQVEHEDTIEPTSLENNIYEQRRLKEKYANLTSDELAKLVDEMDPIKKEDYLETTTFESDEHIKF